MALVNCPECGGQVSDAATACPHCGYPLAEPMPTPTAGVASSLDALGPELANDIRAALAQAGLSGATAGRVSVQVGEPVVTVNGQRVAGPGQGMSAEQVMAAFPQMVGAAAAAGQLRFGLGYDYRSKWTLLGLPLLAMSRGYDPVTGRKRVAKGWVAIGDVAVGGVAIGGAAFGGVCLGGVAVGVVSLGGLAVGLALAVGGVAVGTVAVGGLAIGLWAAGGGAVGRHVLGPNG